MANLLFISLWLPLLGCIFVMFSKKDDNNAFNVTFFILCTILLTILKLFSELNHIGSDFLFSYQWLQHPNVVFTFGVDAFSLILLLGVYASVMIGLVGLSKNQRRNKSLLLLVLYFIWNMSGLLVVRDIISFYLFFAGMQLPLFMLIGSHANIRKSSTLSLFFIFNFLGSLLLLISILVVYRYNHGSVLLSEIGILNIPVVPQLVVLGGVCAAFVLRIPIWPLHNWISYICSGIKNPLIYILTNLFPLSGLYGFIRFGQVIVPTDLNAFVPIIEVFGVLTMMFIALIGLSHKNFLQKLFSYSTVFYLLFLLSKLLLADKYQMNMAYSLFIFLIVNASLAVLDLFAENAREDAGCDYRGVLVYMPRLSKFFAFFVLMAVGLPMSSMFWNNFVLISAIFRESFITGLWIMAAISLIGLALLYELYVMRDLQNKSVRDYEVRDISDHELTFFSGVTFVLFLSFFNPLWFLF